MSDLIADVTHEYRKHSVQQALLRNLDHTAYHVGQILDLTRMLNPNGDWLTIPPGASKT